MLNFEIRKLDRVIEEKVKISGSLLGEPVNFKSDPVTFNFEKVTA